MINPSAGRLFLIPNFIHPDAGVETMPAAVAEAAGPLRIFIVENARSCRALLKKIIPGFPLQECEYFVCDQNTRLEDIHEFLESRKSQDMGIVAEAGMPCVADPGAQVVRQAHELGMRVVPLVGPSAILLALAASGLNGQNFVFHGYLPKEREARKRKIKELEQASQLKNQTQIVMETPYRGGHLFEDLLLVCDPRTKLCVACDLTGPGEMIQTCSIDNWRTQLINLIDRPALFLFQR